MKNVLIALMFAVLMVGCSGMAPDAGEEIVLVQKPYFFGHGGVVKEPITTGRTWVAITTHGIKVNMKPQQFEEPFDDLMSSDGVPLDFDAYIRLRIVDSVKLVEYFGERWYQNNIQAEFRTQVRQAVRQHGLNETAISTSAIDEIDRVVSEGLNNYIMNTEFVRDGKTVKIPVELLAVTVGKANPPDSVKNQRIATAEQQQRALTEKERKNAEDSRLAAEEARAAADNAYRNALGLSTAGWIELAQINMMEKACSKEHGGGSCTFIIGGENPVPVFQVKNIQ